MRSTDLILRERIRDSSRYKQFNRAAEGRVVSDLMRALVERAGALGTTMITDLLEFRDREKLETKTQP